MPGSEADWAARRPHPALRSLVNRYIGYRQRGLTLQVHRGLPSEHVTLVISLAEPVELLGMPGSGQGPNRGYGLLGGLHTAPALIAQGREQAGLQLEISPLGTRALFGLPSVELAERVIDLADLPRPDLVELPQRLRAAAGWAARFDILDQVLLAAAARSSAPQPAAEVSWAWRRLLNTGGAVAVSELAREVGWSRRHFSERFSREIGLTPKQAARVVRFGRTAVFLRRLPQGGLAEVAHRCGYFDQSHLTNEWRALAGCTPSAWLTEELPFLQDGKIFNESGWLA